MSQPLYRYEAYFSFRLPRKSKAKAKLLRGHRVWSIRKQQLHQLMEEFFLSFFWCSWSFWFFRCAWRRCWWGRRWSCWRCRWWGCRRSRWRCTWWCGRRCCWWCMTIGYRETINVACITCYWILCNRVGNLLTFLVYG